MKQFFDRKTVTTTPGEIFSCPMKSFQNVEIYAISAIEFGEPGVALGTGVPLAAGESRSISHLDFRKDDKSIQEDILILYAVSAGTSTVQVSGWRS